MSIVTYIQITVAQADNGKNSDGKILGFPVGSNQFSGSWLVHLGRLHFNNAKFAASYSVGATLASMASTSVSHSIEASYSEKRPGRLHGSVLH